MGGLAHGRFWIDNATFPEQEIAVRFHHKLVYIHPFPNGNGRISRLMAALGSANLVEVSVIRTRYIEALRQADRGDYSALLAFTTPPEARR